MGSGGLGPPKTPGAGGGLHRRPPRGLVAPGPCLVATPTSVWAPDVLGHLQYHVEPHCPKELRVVLSQMKLYRLV